MKKSPRKRMTLKEAYKKFSTEKKAEKWLVEAIYGSREEMYCPRCGSTRVSDVKHPSMPYRCKDCRKHFSIRTGTVMECSRIPLTDWVMEMFTMSSELRSRPAMKTMNDYGLNYNSAWFINHRLRRAYRNLVEGIGPLSGTVEADETAIGGKAGKMNKKQRKAFKERGGSQGFGGKELVAAVKSRESGKIIPAVIEDRTKATLQGFVKENVEEGSTLMTDEADGYKGIEGYDHKSVNHSDGKYVEGDVHNNNLESHWSIIKRAIAGSFYKISPKHTGGYLFEIAGRQNDRGKGTEEMMKELARGMVGTRLTWKDLTAENGKSNFARPEAGSERENVMLVKQGKRRRAKLWKAWKEGRITPETCEELAEMIEAKKAAGKWEDRIPY